MVFNDCHNAGDNVPARVTSKNNFETHQDATKRGLQNQIWNTYDKNKP